MFSRINLFRQQQQLTHASSLKLIMVSCSELHIREPGREVSIAVLCEVEESIFVHSIIWGNLCKVDFREHPLNYGVV